MSQTISQDGIPAPKDPRQAGATTYAPAPTTPPERHVPGVALVFEGGGYRASYTAGFANVLLEHNVSFDVVCGISAGASHAVDYVSRDQKRVHDAFINLTDQRPQAGGVRSFLMGHGYFNADYDYVGCAVDGYMPFDWASFASNPADVRIQSFQADTGDSVTWDKSVMTSTIAMMLHVRASSTLPGMMKPITIDGHLMYDGGIGEGAGLPTHLAEDAGYERMMVVCTRPAGYRKSAPSDATKRLYRAVSHGYEPLYQALCTRSERYNEALDHLAELEREGRALVVRPEVMPVKSTTIDRPRLEAAYWMGHAQGLREWPRWEEWLFG